MGDGGGRRGRHALKQGVSDLVDERDFPRLRLLPLAGPALDLPLDVTAALGQIAEPNRVDVDPVEGDQGVDQLMAHLGPVLDRNRPTDIGIPHDHAIEKVHDVEISPVDRFVLAQIYHPGDRNRAVS